MNILIHQCCGPCSIYPISEILEQGHALSALYYNPNIHPLEEFYRRLEGAINVNNFFGISSIYSEKYGLDDFCRFSGIDKKERCRYCYDMRIEFTAKFAKERGYDCFTSSLLYSKYQNHDEIILLCEAASLKYEVEFYYKDFRVGWKEGIVRSKDMLIYRQQYCGCIFSEEERYSSQLSKQIKSKYPLTESINSVYNDNSLL